MYKGEKNNLMLPQPLASINNLFFFKEQYLKTLYSYSVSWRRYQRRWIAQKSAQETQVQNVGTYKNNTNQQLAGFCASVKSDGHWYGFQDWINPINNTEHAQKYFRLMKIINNKDDSFSTTRNAREYPKENFLKKLSIPTTRRTQLKICSLKLLATYFSILYFPL